MAAALSIAGSACLTCLGDDRHAQLAAIFAGKPTLRPLSELEGAPSGYEDLTAGWIEPRSLLSHRLWAPLSMAALHVARRAVAEAAWDSLEDVPVFFATSRGPVAGVREPWPGRRPTGLMAASNSLPAEPAAAISSEFGISAPWQVLSSGCCAGLDALQMAAVWLRAGEASRALVVAADLPLVAAVLEDYDRSGILAHGDLPGMHPSEGAAAVCLEAKPGLLEIVETLSLSEPEARFGGNRPLPRLAAALTGMRQRHGDPSLLIPHASGTARHRLHEQQALEEALGNPEHLAMKPFTGHCVGASALIELVLGMDQLRRLPAGSSMLKIASALGGKHACAWLRKS
ncbi:beta-ketoacyl synthase N-terminal-like domain-containing protein [Haloferula sargassicola]|uniref:Beta-ketoacyl synthase-like N-terminal domain-containing protein n=1 Tax=Haloferula sargassicola TaxID=490096 RepID=A0ABP9USU8_9BACT